MSDPQVKPGMGLVELETESRRSGFLRSRFWLRYRRHRLALAGTIILVILVAIAVLAPLITTHDPLRVNMRDTKEPPNEVYVLGTDKAGRDIWARLAFASRISLSVGVVSVSIYIVIGTLLGAIAGYYGGLTDSLIMRFTDTVMSFPGLIIIITVVSFVGPSI